MGEKPVKLKMALNENISNELKAISSTVASVPYVNVFTVDPLYFPGIEIEVSARISADEFYSSGGSFTIPLGYFETLSAHILQKIKSGENNEVSAEINELSSVLAGISKDNVYHVPEGYFAQLEFVAEKAAQAKVIQMNPSRSRSIFRYAAAAVITGMLGISVINIVDKSGSSNALKDGSEIQFATKDVLAKATHIIQSGTLDHELNDLSDREIEQYLQQNGQDAHAAMVAASVNNEGKLPDAADYILDENTLDNYLKDNNLKN